MKILKLHNIYIADLNEIFALSFQKTYTFFQQYSIDITKRVKKDYLNLFYHHIVIECIETLQKHKHQGNIIFIFDSTSVGFTEGVETVITEKDIRKIYQRLKQTKIFYLLSTQAKPFSFFKEQFTHNSNECSEWLNTFKGVLQDSHNPNLQTLQRQAQSYNLNYIKQNTIETLRKRALLLGKP